MGICSSDTGSPPETYQRDIFEQPHYTNHVTEPMGLVLHYLPLRGRAEPLRMLLHYAGLGFDDHVFTFSEWALGGKASMPKDDQGSLSPLTSRAFLPLTSRAVSDV